MGARRPLPRCRVRDAPRTSTRTSEEIREIASLFGGATYVHTFEQRGRVTPRSVRAHDVHPALDSGVFPLRRDVDAGVRAGGSNVGAGAFLCC